MLKKEIIDRIAEKASVTKKDTEAILQEFEQLIINTLADDRDEKITLGTLGSFQVKKVTERKGKISFGNKKGTEWVKPAHDEICFKVNKASRELA